jgi:hypothetical protein
VRLRTANKRAKKASRPSRDGFAKMLLLMDMGLMNYTTKRILGGIEVQIPIPVVRLWLTRR